MSFQDKFKSRKPEETIQIVKDFFYDRGFELVICAITSEIDT